MENKLSSSFKLKNGIEIKNRFYKSAMSEQLGDSSHNPKSGLANVYKRWAKGGTGINISGNIMIDRSALGEPKNVVLDNESDLDAFRHWTKHATEDNTHFWAQLNHPGKQSPSFLSKVPVAPSAISLGPGFESSFNTPRELTDNEISELIKKYALSAKLAKEVGFTGVQIHGAHGYLVSQFLSPRHNQRIDKWGGSLENRMRFVLEIYTAMREEVGDNFPISIKLNSADFMKGGFTEDDSMEVVKALSAAGIDLIEISGGTYESPSMMGDKKNTQQKESTKKREAYFLDYAHKVRAVVDTPLSVTGGFRTSEGMQMALDDGATDFIGLARPVAINPDVPNLAMKDKDFTLTLPEPSTGLKGLDRAMMIGLVWYESQIHIMAQGLEPNPKLSAWSSVWMTLKGIGSHAFTKRRG